MPPEPAADGIAAQKIEEVLTEKYKREIFTAFVRGNNVGSIEGTGLGLMLVQYLVQQHLGQIHIKSSIHKGTAVLISFPYNTFE